MDESGHDHREMPYEVRGGIAIHASKLWPFVQQIQRLEYSSYGAILSEFRSELKGSKLLDKDRFAWSLQSGRLGDDERRKHCRSFLTKGLEKKAPIQVEFTAYGQASLEMARGLFQLLHQHDARLFAAAIPRGVQPPANYQAEDYLRKDQVFLLERFFYFLESKREYGLLVMDQMEKTADRRFVRRLHNYFQNTQTGRYRSKWIVPTPFFVSSDMSYPVQVADLCIYCINWGFRVPAIGMDQPNRAEITAEFGPWVDRLQFEGDGYKDGNVFHTYGVVFVPDPYTSR